MNSQPRQFSVGDLRLFFAAVAFVFLAAFGVKGASQKPVADFDGDGKSDVSVFRPSDGFWYVAKSSGGYSSVLWGLGTDTPLAGDYDGDRKADYAVFRRSVFNGSVNNNNWYILGSLNNDFRAVTWVPNSPWFYYDAPVAADFDGDSKTDISVFRNSDAIGETGRFVILQSLSGTGNTLLWGKSVIDRAVPADYDGDGKADLAVYRGTEMATQVYSWIILQSSDNTTRTVRFGLPSDKLVPADYDGDGKTDIAVWRPSSGVWYRLNSNDGSFSATLFGASDDKPVPADYDGDGKADIAVYRPSNGVWYLQQSTAGFTGLQFGASEDIPIPYTLVR